MCCAFVIVCYLWCAARCCLFVVCRCSVCGFVRCSVCVVCCALCVVVFVHSLRLVVGCLYIGVCRLLCNGLRLVLVVRWLLHVACWSVFAVRWLRFVVCC